jgi:hypothetical protein
VTTEAEREWCIYKPKNMAGVGGWSSEVEETRKVTWGFSVRP